ncbi:hypothetical protein EDD85DRAFT_944989 [Armillaria nabsnona]|nr:hypothetical protein EDD85DRAFT_944989 [Armillaria nabsnona]
MSSLPSTATPSLGNTLGALYIGSTIAAILFGITNLQTVIYYKKYPDDWWIYRYSVALLWVLDALHVALSTHALYVYLIDMFGDLAGVLVHSVRSFKVICWVPTIELSNRVGFYTQVQLGINALIVIYVQEYKSHRYSKGEKVLFYSMRFRLYAIRLWKFGRHFHKFWPWLVFLIMAAVLGSMGILMIYAICITSNFSDVSNVTTEIHIIFVMMAATDFVIALMMCYYLHKSRVATNFSTFNYRSEPHESNRLNSERIPKSNPTVLRIIPHTSEGSTAGTNISIPLSDIEGLHSFVNKLDHSKGALDHSDCV